MEAQMADQHPRAEEPVPRERRRAEEGRRAARAEHAAQEHVRPEESERGEDDERRARGEHAAPGDRRELWERDVAAGRVRVERQAAAERGREPRDRERAVPLEPVRACKKPREEVRVVVPDVAAGRRQGCDVRVAPNEPLSAFTA